MHSCELCSDHTPALGIPSPSWSCPPPSPRSWWWGRWCSRTPRKALSRRLSPGASELRKPSARDSQQIQNLVAAPFSQFLKRHYNWHIITFKPIYIRFYVVGNENTWVMVKGTSVLPTHAGPILVTPEICVLTPRDRHLVPELGPELSQGLRLG